LFVEPDASLVLGMLLAQKGTIPEGITEQFRMTGVSHILAISGLHVSIMAGFIYLLVSWLPLSGWWRTGLLLLIVWVYILFIGAPVSAVRAGSFITVAMVFLRLSRLVSLPTALAGTVGVSVVVNPAVILEVGWQLSIGAVTGIFLMLFVTKQTQPRLAKGGVARWLFNSVIVSTGAFLATWPLMVYHFGNLSLISLLANVLVVPIVPFVLMSALSSLIISVVWMGGAVMVAALTHLFIRWLVFITGILSQWPGVYFEELSIPVWSIVLYFVGLLTVVHIVLLRQKRSWREVWA
jgi:competence protein ComEC